MSSDQLTPVDGLCLLKTYILLSSPDFSGPPYRVLRFRNIVNHVGATLVVESIRFCVRNSVAKRIYRRTRFAADSTPRSQLGFYEFNGRCDCGCICLSASSAILLSAIDFVLNTHSSNPCSANKRCSHVVFFASA